MTAEEILELHYNMGRDEDGYPVYYDWSVKDAMIAFARLHVEAALKAACEKAELEDIDRPEDFCEYDGVNGFSKILNKNVLAFEGYYHVCINSDSVLNAYSLENIK